MAENTNFLPEILNINIDKTNICQGSCFTLTADIIAHGRTDKDYEFFVYFIRIGRSIDLKRYFPLKPPAAEWKDGQELCIGPYCVPIPEYYSIGQRRILIGIRGKGQKGKNIELLPADPHERDFMYWFGSVDILPRVPSGEGNPEVWPSTYPPDKPRKFNLEGTWVLDNRFRYISKLNDKRCELLLIGDSITEGWINPEQRELWDKVFRKYNTVNVAVSGARTQSMLAVLEEEIVRGLGPKAAMVMLGVNNILGSPSHSAEDIAKGIKAVLVKLHRNYQGIKILLLATFPAGEEKSDPARTKIERINEIISDYGKMTGVIYLDINHRFLNNHGRFKDGLTDDFIHLSNAGYRIWADAICDTVSRIMIG